MFMCEEHQIQTMYSTICHSQQNKAEPQPHACLRFTSFLLLLPWTCSLSSLLLFTDPLTECEELTQRGMRGRGEDGAKKEQKQTRDTWGSRRRGLRLKPHKKNNLAVGEELREGGETNCAGKCEGKISSELKLSGFFSIFISMCDFHPCFFVKWWILRGNKHTLTQIYRIHTCRLQPGLAWRQRCIKNTRCLAGTRFSEKCERSITFSSSFLNTWLLAPCPKQPAV